MRFFIPDMEHEQAEAAWADMLAATERIMDRPYEMRRIRRLKFVADGSEIDAAVGERRRETTRNGSTHPTGNRIAAIFAGNPYVVWEVPEGPSTWQNPAVVGPNAIIAVEEFDDQTSGATL